MEIDSNMKVETLRRELNEMTSIKNAMANRVDELRKVG